MIRINLLPQKRRSAARPSELWLVAGLVAVLLEVAVCFVVYGMRSDELAVRKRQNRALSAEVDKLKNVARDHAGVKEKLAKLQSRETAIDRLESARTGPTQMLLEIAKILTPGRGPSIDPAQLSRLRRESPLSDYNSDWDTRRLWLLRFVESNRKVRLEGLARDGEDVSELARRMNLSSFFEDVTLLPAKRENHGETGLQMVSFQLEAKVRY